MLLHDLRGMVTPRAGGCLCDGFTVARGGLPLHR